MHATPAGPLVGPASHPFRRRIAICAALALAVSAVAGSAAQSRPVAASDTMAGALGHAVVFSRFRPDAEFGELVRIDAGGTTEHVIRDVFDAAVLSPDKTRFLDFAPTADDRASTAIYNVDGSNYRVLPLLDDSLDLPGGAWLGTDRIAIEGWGRDGNEARVSVYTRRVSDGGGLVRLSDAGTRHDRPVSGSPDGSKLLFFRPAAKNETGDSSPQVVYVVDADGQNLRRISPDGTTTAFVFSHDAVGWSPDGRRVAMVLANGPFWTNASRSIHIVGADGSGLKRIGPRGDIWDVAWSPDGKWLALTMATRAENGHHQIYLMRPDGSDLKQLTSTADGRVSALQPIWSPDGRQLLFISGAETSGDAIHLVDLWSIDADGSNLRRVTDTPAGYNAVAWLP